jgi:hypothetical protein
LTTLTALQELSTTLASDPTNSAAIDAHIAAEERIREHHRELDRTIPFYRRDIPLRHVAAPRIQEQRDHRVFRRHRAVTEPAELPYLQETIVLWNCALLRSIPLYRSYIDRLERLAGLRLTQSRRAELYRIFREYLHLLTEYRPPAPSERPYAGHVYRRIRVSVPGIRHGRGAYDIYLRHQLD